MDLMLLFLFWMVGRARHDQRDTTRLLRAGLSAEARAHLEAEERAAHDQAQDRRLYGCAVVLIALLLGTVVVGVMSY